MYALPHQSENAKREHLLEFHTLNIDQRIL